MAVVSSTNVGKRSLIHTLPMRQHLLPATSIPVNERSTQARNATSKPDPLELFSHTFHESSFNPVFHLDSKTQVPPRPKTFQDEYLYPTLTDNEYSRLVLVWYYTRGLQKDVELLSKLSHMLEIIKTSLGWEIGIVGLSEAEHYTRLVAKNVPLTTMPRRESTCSHTINQPPGTVLSMLDMANDWRFQGSPAVAKGGLNSYAGTQLLFPLNDGTQVSWGSLCVASLQQQSPLSDEQKETLVKAAEVISGEIVARKRLQRAQEKQSMLEQLSRLRLKAQAESIDTAVVAELRARYPECVPMIVPIVEGNIRLLSGESIAAESIQDGMWEDATFIESIVESGMFDRSINGRKIRLVSAHITTNEQVIVLATSELRCIFDDLDAWFMDQCAQTIDTSAQARLLREAFAAKNTFLRSITHELRTPIHAILSSVELAREEISFHSQSKTGSSGHLDPLILSPFLDTIRRSGTDLMTTVNNILRLNAFVGDMKSHPSDYDMRSLEAHVLEEIFANYTEGQMSALSIRFESAIPDAGAYVRVDGDLLKELLKYLILNAINATPSGSIVVKTSLGNENRSIIIDVVDTGIGIAEVDQQRIFHSFEKVNPHAPGAGLGLSLASQTALTLNGKVSLISSQPNKGSHFQIRIPYLAAGVKGLPHRNRTLKMRHLPLKFHTVQHSRRSIHLVKHLERHLQHRRLERSDSARGSLIVMNQPRLFHEHRSILAGNLEEPHVILYVCNELVTAGHLEWVTATFRGHLVFPVSGPLFASRIDEILVEADSAFEAYLKAMDVPVPRLKVVSASNSTSSIPSIGMPTPPATPSVEPTRPILTAVRERPPVKALLVDDNSVNLSVLQMYCKRRKIPHGTATDGIQAVNNYCANAVATTKESSPYTIIFMDLQMPECDGIEACRRIRKYEEEHDLQRSTILILTGQDSVADRSAAFEAGVDDYYVKPVSMKKLDQAVAQYFSTSPGWV